MAKPNITGHGQDYCGTKHCKGDICGGAGNKLKTNRPSEYTSITEAIRESIETDENVPLLTIEVYDQVEQAVERKDKVALKQLLTEYNALSTYKILSSGVFSSKEVDKFHNEGLVRLADIYRNPNVDPSKYSKLDELIKHEAVGDKKMETFIRKQCMKAIRANPKTPKKIIVDDLSANIPKLSGLIREIEELKQHPLSGGLPNPVVEIMEGQANGLSGAIAEAVKHPSILSEDIPKIYRFGKTEEFYDSILSNPNCGESWINSIPEGRPVIVEKFLKHPKLNEANITKYSKSSKTRERMAIAQNPSASQKVISELCNDIDANVALEAKAHINAPEHFIGMQIDSFKQKRQSLIHNFSLFVNNPGKDMRFEQEAINGFQSRISEADKAINLRKERLLSSAKNSATMALDDILN